MTRVALDSRVGITAVESRHCFLVCHGAVAVAVKKRRLGRSQLLRQNAEESRSWHWQICSVQLSWTCMLHVIVPCDDAICIVIAVMR